MKNEDLVSYNVMTMGYAVHGHASQAMQLFDNMRKQDLQPEAYTYDGVPMACSNAGQVEEGLQYFEE